MAMTVGELVGYLDLEDKGFAKELDKAERSLGKLQSTTTSKTASIEASVVKTFHEIEQAVKDGLDPTAAVAQLDQLEAALEDTLREMERDAERFSKELERAVDEAFDDLEKRAPAELEVDVDADITPALAALTALEGAAEAAGEKAGTAFTRGADGRLRDARGRFVRASSDVFGGAADQAARVGAQAGTTFVKAAATGARSGGPYLIAAGAGLAAIVGPAIGAAVGGAIVAGIGAQLTSLGIKSLFVVQEVDKSWSAFERKRVEAANKQAEQLQSQFGELKRDITLAMQEAADPLRSVLDEVRVQARGLAKDIGPDLREGFEQARVPLQQFIRDASAGLKDLSDSIPSLMDGFGDILGEIDIKGFLADLGDSFDDLGRAVSDNRSAIGAVFNALLDVIPLVIDGLTSVINFFGKMGLAVMQSAAFIAEHMANATSMITGLGTSVLQVVRTIGENLSNVPGMEALGQKIVEGADAGIRKLDEFQRTADQASRSVRLKADITELQMQLDKAFTLLDDPNLSKERRSEITAEIQRLLDAKGKALLELGDPALIKEYKSQISADISALQSRLADARKELKDPDLTKERKAELKAEIGQLKDGVKLGKQALDGVKGKTVKVDADAKDAVKEVGKVKTGLDGLEGEAKKAGQNVGSGLSSGIRSHISEAVAAARQLASSALKAAKDFFGIRSPSTEMAEVGKWTVKGLIQGLTEEEGNVRSTVERMVKMVKDAFSSQPDVAEGLIAFIAKGNKSLEDLALHREALVKRLADAKEYAKQIAGDAKEWAAITGLSKEEIESGDFVGSLKDRAQALKDFANDIKTLAERGLNKETLRQIIEGGVDKGASIAEALVGAPGSEIKAINRAQAQINKMSQQLGKNGADALFDVGKKAGDGYLKGLQESLKKLDKEMEKIVSALVRAIKKELKIKSPSQVFADIGMQTIQGLAVGMNNAANSAVSAMQGVASKVASAAGNLAGSMPTPSLVPIGGPSPAGSGFGGGGAPGLVPGSLPGQGGVTVNVDMSGSTVREEADLHRINSDFGFNLMAQGLP